MFGLKPSYSKMFVYITLFILFGFEQAFGQTYPSYAAIQTKFIASYKAGLVNNSSRIIFEKRPEGWYVRQVEFFPKPHTVKHEMWWQKKDDSYLELSFDQNNSNSTTDSFTGSDRHSESLYDKFLYFGYRGWERDVMNVLKQPTSTTNHLTLALCYASLANELLIEDSYAYDQTYVSSTDNYLNEHLYKEWTDSSIYYLKKIVSQDADFYIDQVKVQAHIKLQEIKKAINLSIYFGHEGAVKGLSDSMLSASDKAYFKNILNSCPENSVLFVSGDVDALPLAYLSQRLNIRPDVSILDQSLLANPLYRQFAETANNVKLFSVVSADLEQKQIDFIRVIRYNRIRQKQRPGESFATQKIRMEGIPDNAYQIEDFDLAQEYSDLRHLLQFVTQDFDNEMDNGLTRYKYFPTHGIILHTNRSFIQWKIENRMLTKADLIFMDVLATQINLRPICVLSSTPEANLLGMNDLKLIGLVYQLYDNEQNHLANNFSNLETELLYKKLMYDFDWVEVDNLTNFQYEMYWSLFNGLIRNLNAREKYAGAYALVDRYFEIFKPEAWQNAESVLDLVEYYFIFEKFDQGHKLLLKIREQLRSRNFVQMNDLDYIEANQQVKRLLNLYYPPEVLQKTE